MHSEIRIISPNLFSDMSCTPAAKHINTNISVYKYLNFIIQVPVLTRESINLIVTWLNFVGSGLIYGDVFSRYLITPVDTNATQFAC